ncbi:uncharacterized protein LOC124651319 [Lolium rigidum]|uniref:uncharacterized protein LOC124651319 n=1 Tax=Lolium rigidum TaxID=89674 RepID=UPI001F5C613D|nr:uncharacterized protein LOC124651319 [Lolium rigidum]
MSREVRGGHPLQPPSLPHLHRAEANEVQLLLAHFSTCNPLVCFVSMHINCLRKCPRRLQEQDLLRHDVDPAVGRAGGQREQRHPSVEPPSRTISSSAQRPAQNRLRDRTVADRAPHLRRCAGGALPVMCHNV